MFGGKLNMGGRSQVVHSGSFGKWGVPRERVEARHQAGLPTIGDHAPVRRVARADSLAGSKAYSKGPKCVITVYSLKAKEQLRV